MKKKLLLGLSVVLGFSGLANGAAFEILSRGAGVSASGSPRGTGNDSFSESAVAPADFTSFDASLDVPGSARQSSTIDAGADYLSIDSNGGASASSAYSGGASSSFKVTLQVFEPTAYSVGGTAFRGLSGGGSVTFSNAATGYEIFRNFPTRPPTTGILQTGVYELRGTAFGSSPRTGSGGGSYDLTFRLGSSSVPEASQSVCFLAGSVMFLFAGTRRRRQLV